MATLKWDQSQLAAGFLSVGSLPVIQTTAYLAQAFVPSVTGNLTDIVVQCGRKGSTIGNLTLTVYATDGNGAPTGTNLGSATVLEANIIQGGTTNGYYVTTVTFTFGSPIALTASTKYAFVLSTTGGDQYTNHYRCFGMLGTADYYSPGCTYYSSDSGSNWSKLTTTDLAFATKMDTAVATPGLDQFAIGEVYNAYIPSGSAYSQTFVPSVSASLSKLKLIITVNGSPISNSAVTVAIYAVDGANKPTGSALSSVENIGSSILENVSSNLLAFTVTFATPASLTLGTRYAIVINFPGPSAYIIYIFSTAHTDQYPNGQAWVSTDGGSTWAADSYDVDLAFGTMMSEVTTTPQTIDSDADISGTTSRTINSGAIIQITSTQTIDSDGTIQITTPQTIDADTIIQATSVKTIDSDAFCGAQVSQTIDANADVGATVSQTVQSDAFVGEITTHTIPADSYIVIPISQTIDSDAFVGEITIRTILSNAIVQITNSHALDSDAEIIDITTQVINANANITGTLVQTILSRANVSITTVQTIQSGAVIIINAPVIKLYVVV